MTFTGEHVRSEGQRCSNCGKTEAACALTYPCCQDGCRHFRHLDANGNDKPKPTPVVRIDSRPFCPECGRRVSARGRFDCAGLCASLRRAYDTRRWQQSRSA